MIIQRAMAKEPHHRYQTMEELDAELALYDMSEPEAREPTSPGVPGPRTSLPSAPRAQTMQLRQAQQVSMARPLILLLSILGLFWVAGSLITLVTAIIRLSRGGGVTDNLTGLEAVLLASGIGFALITPALIGARHVRRNVWNNSMKAVDLSDNLRRPIVVGLCAYGFASLLVRVVEAVVLRRAAGVAWPMWDVVLFGIGAVGAAGAYL
ncbi:hypothetical protein BE08_11720, partial [Sorangium cellulosum]